MPNLDSKTKQLIKELRFDWNFRKYGLTNMQIGIIDDVYRRGNSPQKYSDELNTISLAYHEYKVSLIPITKHQKKWLEQMYNDVEFIKHRAKREVGLIMEVINTEHYHGSLIATELHRMCSQYVIYRKKLKQNQNK